jgi:NAD(P)-dependent dehydrogenase (short-subunit alcohol dehydrogenase family)/acyl carrier protein
MPKIVSIPNILHAPILGFMKSFMNEFPDVHSSCIDLSEDLDEIEDNIINLIAEITQNKSRGLISYRNKIRYIARLTQIDKNLNTTFRPVFVGDASYIITGGGGAIGIQLAKWMIAKGAKNIYLLGRKLPSRPEFLNEIKQLAPKVFFIKCDITNLNELKAIYENINYSGAPLKGIMHLAGLIDDATIINQTADKFAQVMLPKILGSWNLYLCSKDMSLDFFSCFSSISSVLGMSGQSNYAAANAFMDSFALFLRSRNVPGLTINWGPWADFGMAADLNKNDQLRLKEQGIEFLSSKINLELLELLLLNPTYHQIMVAKIDWQKFFVKRTTKFNDELFLKLKNNLLNFASEQPQNSTEILSQLKNISPTNAKRILEKYIWSVIKAILGAEPDGQSISNDTGFIEMGLDSLASIGLRSKIQRELNISLSTTFAFDYPNVDAVVNYLINALDFSKKSVAESEVSEQLDILDQELQQLELLIDE